jgi:hypothetical protein
MDPTARSPHAAQTASHRRRGNRFVRRTTAWATAGALGVTGAFTALAGWSSRVSAHTNRPAGSTHAPVSPAPVNPSQGSAGSPSTTPGTTPDTSSQGGLAAPDTTPQFTQQPPVAASGGS